MESLTNEIENLYVIATIFNPANFKKRYNLYHDFEQHMKQSGVMLVTIECIYGEEKEYSVTQAGNPFHMQVRTEHPLWHKENLINIAIRRLPETWKYALWIDADIEFLEEDWPQRVIESFKKYEIIQIFKSADFLGPKGEVLETHLSFNYALVNDIPIDRKHYDLFYPHPGYGWGITKSAFYKLNGLIDQGILGSGDSHMASSLINKFDYSFVFNTNLFHFNYIKLVQDWQNKVQEYVLNGQVGFADCAIKHFFHGYREDRKYVERLKILMKHKFDPIKDLLLHNDLYQLKPEKKELCEEIISYFMNRNEDRGEARENENYKSLNSYKTMDQILKDIAKLKKIVENDKFSESFKNIYKNKPDNNNERRSRSSANSQRRNHDTRPRKKIEIYFEMNLNKSWSNDSSTDESINSLNQGNLSPRSANLNTNMDNFISNYGNCCSGKKKEKKNKEMEKNNANNANTANNGYNNQNKEYVANNPDLKNNNNNSNKPYNNQTPNIKNPPINNNQPINQNKKNNDKKKKKKNGLSEDYDNVVSEGNNYVHDINDNNYNSGGNNDDDNYNGNPVHHNHHNDHHHDGNQHHHDHNHHNHHDNNHPFDNNYHDNNNYDYNNY